MKESVSTDAIETTESVSENSRKKEEQPATWKRSSNLSNSTKLMVGDQEEIPLKGTQMAVKVDGFRARVLLDYYFFNDREMQLEGTFKLQLPPDASPYYLAFGQTVIMNKNEVEFPTIDYKKEKGFSFDEIREERRISWENVKEAKIVPKEKAAFAYSETVKRKIDPAIMEWAGPDIFNCRVFPLFPQQMHRITIGYDINLTETENGRVLDIFVPQQGDKTVLNLKILNKKDLQPTIEPAVNTDSEEEYLTFHSDDFKEAKISVSYRGNLPITLTGNQENQSYFASSLALNLPAEIQSNNNGKAILALDFSLSNDPDKFNIWLNLAKALLNNNRNTIRKFKIIYFSIGTYWWKEEYVANTPENVEEFIANANQITLEGATNISGLLKTLTKVTDKDTDIFLLSDGAATWGESNLGLIIKNANPEVPVYAYKTGIEGTDNKFLEKLTSYTGGGYFSVASEKEITTASTAHLKKPWKIEEITVEGCSDILIAGNSGYLYPNQKILITGRGNPKEDIIIKASQDEKIKVFELNTGQIISSDLCSRIFGQVSTGLLEEFETETYDHAVAYATHFRIPGQTCSLLMLEGDSDYQRFNINEKDNALVVLSSSINNILNELSSVKNSNSDKKELLSIIERLSSDKAFNLSVPKQVTLFIKGMPDKSFIAEENLITVKPSILSETDKHLLSAYNSTEPDYEILMQEAEEKFQQKGNESALLTLSSLVEKNPGNTVIIADVAYSAMEMNMESDAYFLLKRLNKLRPYEPNSYLAIAQALDKMNKKDLAMVYYEIALNTTWPNEYRDFKSIVKRDYIYFLRQLARKNKNEILPEIVESRLNSLEDELEDATGSLVACILWNTDNTDIDLHVTEPSGETCFYANKTTKSGGSITQDVTTGHGPEMYTNTKSYPGEYKISVNYYSGNVNRTSTRTKVYATIYLNWGKSDESVIRKAITLKENNQKQDVLSFRVKG